MVSIRERLKSELVASLENRTSKMPIVLDHDDFVYQVERGVRKLDEMLFNPRSILLTNASSGLVDVTALNIDEVTNVYYSEDSANNLLGGMDLGIGLLPMLGSQGVPTTSLESMIDFLILKGVINTLQRKMRNCMDFSLLPLGEDGHQYLQVQNPGNLFWVEYLPHINPKDDGWALYENEFLFLEELCFAYICHAHTESLAQVSILGAGKEAIQLLTYWDKKIEDIIKAFQDSSVLSYIA